MVRIAAIKVRGLKRLAALQSITEIKRIHAAGYANLLQLVLFDGDLPRSAPAQRAKPDTSLLLVVGAFAVDGKPRIVLRPCCSSSAFQHCLAWMNWLLLHVPFSSPSTCEIPQPVVGSTRQVPRACRDLFDCERRSGAVRDIRRTPQNPGFGVELVFERDIHLQGDVFHHDRKFVSVD